MLGGEEMRRRGSREGVEIEDKERREQKEGGWDEKRGRGGGGRQMESGKPTTTLCG